MLRASAPSSAKQTIVAKFTIRWSHAATSQEFVIIEVSIADPESSFAESIFVIKDTHTAMPSYEEAIAKPNPIRPWPTAIPPSVSRIMAVDELATLPTLIMPTRPAATSALS